MDGMWMDEMRTETPWATMRVWSHAQHERKHVWSVSVCTPVGYRGSLSTVNEIIFNKQKINKKKFLYAHFQFLFHHDVLEEWCHRLYWSGRRFFVETAARKSDRSFTGPFLSALFRVRYHCPLYLLLSSWVSLSVWSSFATFFFDSVRIQRVKHSLAGDTKRSANAKKQNMNRLKSAGGRQVDSPIHTEYVHSCGETTLIFIVSVPPSCAE